MIYIGIGIGFLCGSLFMDALWRIERRLEKQLIAVQRERIEQLERLAS